jgi:single-stranded-DNA-specific exonuclease
VKSWRVLNEWREPGDDPGPANHSAGRVSRPAFPGIPAPLASVLAGRGVHSVAELDRFLRPRLSDLADPFQLPGMNAAVDRIWRAIQGGESIVVYGDYDVDGITSAALMVLVLERLGARVTPYLPKRMEEGYGLGIEALRRCLDQFHPGLIVTTDCGTGSVEAVRMASAAGVDVVVTDHHESGGELAPAVAVVNPKLGSDLLARTLAGVGVAFKVCHALIKRGREGGRKEAEGVDLRDTLDLVALGTIADVVPLLGENRILASHGLLRLNRRERLGLQALGEVAGASGDLGAYHVAFVLGPRLNAAGRMGTADAALELLLTGREERARSLAAELDVCNRERKRIEKEILDEAVGRIEAVFDPAVHHGIVVGDHGWHVGVIGIVAARLSGRYGLPAIVVGFGEDGVGRGSCRSVEGFDLLEGLKSCDSLLARYGGHAMAAGLEIHRDNFEKFQESFRTFCTEALGGRDLRKTLLLESWVGMGDVLDKEFLRVLEGMAPFGEGNPEPVWGMREVQVEGEPRVVGGSHLKMTLVSGGRACEAIGFNMGAREVPQGPLDVAFTVRRNTYQGRTTTQLQLQDFRAADTGQSVA